MLSLTQSHLRSLDLLPELETALEQVLAHDVARVDQNRQWSAVVPALLKLLGVDQTHALPFATAWCLMYGAISRLDHLQDGDEDATTVLTADLPTAALYNLALGHYVFAASLLDRLSLAHFTPARLRRLRSLWSEQMLRMASGQQRDLLAHHRGTRVGLESYQELAQYKTGATFALAFAGGAALATDDESTIDALFVAGEIYGLLLQCCDDLADIELRPDAAGTLGSALQASTMGAASPASADAFLAHVYRSCWSHLTEALAPLPETLKAGVFDIFRQTFGNPIASSRIAADEY